MNVLWDAIECLDIYGKLIECYGILSLNVGLWTSWLCIKLCIELWINV